MAPRLIFALLCLAHLQLVAADEVRGREPKITEDIRDLLPAEWECHFEPGAGTKYAPAGLGRPDFVLLVTNPKLVATRWQHPKRGLIEVKPIIPLSFYPITEKASVLKTIEKQALFSWVIPAYFGETASHIVVTSPAWVNEGHYSLDSRQSIRAPLILLRTLLRDPEERSSMVKSLLSDREDGS